MFHFEVLPIEQERNFQRGSVTPLLKGTLQQLPVTSVFTFQNAVEVRKDTTLLTYTLLPYVFSFPF